jgi:hypothetical protein
MRKSSSLKGDWKNFLRYYEGATGAELNPPLMRLLLWKVSPTSHWALVDEANCRGSAFGD